MKRDGNARERKQSVNDLGNYLNDHLGGSVSALNLIDRLVETYKGKPLEQFFRDLRNEIAADQKTLEELVERLGEKESVLKEAGAWVAEKLSRAMIRLSDDEEGEMGLFLALEGLALGIHGKRSLWRALAAASEMVPGLRGPDYATLEQRASEQHDRVETRRLGVARDVFGSG